MSCEDCGHFVGDRPDWRNRNSFTGKCSLNPVWVEVKSHHYCGQEHRTFNTPAALEQQRISRSEAWDNYQVQRERAITAEKSLKAIRKQLRTERGQRAESGDQLRPSAGLTNRRCPE